MFILQRGHQRTQIRIPCRLFFRPTAGLRAIARWNEDSTVAVYIKRRETKCSTRMPFYVARCEQILTSPQLVLNRERLFCDSLSKAKI